MLITRANLLSSKAFDSLHSQMKRSFVGVTFILCVDDINSVPKKSAALFYPLEVRPPGVGDAVIYIQRLCDANRVSFEIESAEALADFSRSSYQGLALDFEILLERNQFNVAGIVEHFSSGSAIRYVDQVFDRASFSAQLSTLEEWEFETDSKIDRIGAYLSQIFDVRHGLHPGSLRWLERFAKLSNGIIKHSTVLQIQPRVFATRMLQIWSPEKPSGPTTLRRKASEFDDLFAGVMIDVGEPDSVTSTWRANARRTRELRQTETREKGKLAALPSIAPDTTSLTLEEATRLWDGASFMVQSYGVFLNSYIEIRHSIFDLNSTKSPEQITTDFLHELRMFVRRARTERSAEFHALYAHQNEGGRLLTRIAAHIPSCKSDPRAWIARFVRRRVTKPDDQAIRLDLDEGKASFARHLELIQNLCSGLLPISPNHQVFLRRTKISARKVSWRPGVKITAQRIGLSRLIDRKEQAKASRDLDVLSAFDSPDRDPCSAWEWQQFEYRRQVNEQRELLEQAARQRSDGGSALAGVLRQWKDAKPLREASRPGIS